MTLVDRRALARTLDAIERELRSLGWWQSGPAPEFAEAEAAPFGGSVLSFEQWVQFVLLPRGRSSLAGAARLPASSSVGAMAVRHYDGVDEADRLVSLLSELDALVEAPSRVLANAVNRGDFDAARKALDAGACADADDGYGTRLIELAVCGRSRAVVRLLLGRGATPTATSMCWAAQKGRAGNLRLLLHCGMGPDTSDSYGVTPLFHAAAGGDLAATTMLLESDPSKRSVPRVSPLRGHTAAARALLDAGADPNQRFRRTGPTPLMLATACEARAVVRLLLSRGADPEARDEHGRRASDWTTAR